MKNSYFTGTAPMPRKAVKSAGMIPLKRVTPKKLVTTMPKSMFKRTPKMMMSAVKAKFKK